MSKPIVVTSEDWNPNSIKFMPPKVNERGGKSVNMINTETKRSLHVSTPLMMTWGISDFVNDAGENDGKFSMTLNFPNNEYSKPSTDVFLEKLKEFESKILDAAVENSELWWGEDMSREVCKHSFYPLLKYQKDKVTKKFDKSKPPSIKAKVPCYDGRWAVELYDTSDKLIFPCDEQKHLTPVDFVPKLSQVACVLQCGGVWIGGKGWGVTWKLVQCVVKPRNVESVYGRCHIKLSEEDRGAIDRQTIKDGDDEPDEDDEAPPVSVFNTTKVEQNTQADDSDEEVEEEAAPEPVPVVKKKVVKKAAPVHVEAAAPPKKKVVKKKVVSAEA
jgi:hypothetical protein